MRTPKLFFLTALLTCFTISSSHGSTTTVSEREELKGRLTAIQNSLKNYRVRGQYRIDKWRPERSKWELSTSARGGVLYEARDNPRFHLQVDELVGRWFKGSSEDYFLESSIASYDGRIGQQLYLRTGSPSRSVQIRRGSLKGTAPDDGEGLGDMLSGWRATIFDRILNKNFLLMLDDPSVTVEHVQVEAGKRIHIATTTANLRVAYILDNEHLGLLEERFEIDGKLKVHWKIDSFFPPKIGIAYPKSATRTRYDNDGRVTERAVYTGESVQLNDESVTDDSFRISWPDWCYVTDEITQTTFMLAPSQNEMLQRISDQCDRSAEKLRNAGTPIPTSPSDERRIRSPQVRSVTPSAQPSSNAVISILLPETGTYRANNCGLNTLAFLLQLHGIRANLDDLATSLGVGSHWERVTSLRDLKVALVASGLEVEGYKNTTVDELIEFSRDRRMVFHVQQRSDRPAHYLVMLAGNDQGAYVVDPLNGDRWRSREEVLEKYGRTFTGLCLGVREAVFEASVIGDHEYDVNVGELLEGDSTYVIEVPFLNPGEEPVEILKSSGTCNCYQGVWPRTLAPGEETTLEFRFDAERFGIGKTRRRVVLETDSEETAEIAIDFNADIMAIPLDRKIVWFPAVLDFGTVSASTLPNTTDLTVVLPSGVEISPPADQGAIRLERFGGSEIVGRDVRTTHRYRAILTSLELPESIRLTTKGALQKEIVVPIRSADRNLAGHESSQAGPR